MGKPTDERDGGDDDANDRTDDSTNAQPRLPDAAKHATAKQRFPKTYESGRYTSSGKRAVGSTRGNCTKLPPQNANTEVRT